MASESVRIEGIDLPGGEEAGISEFVITVQTGEMDFDGQRVILHTYLSPDEEIYDAQESDFPVLTVNLTKQQFKSVLKMMMRFDEQL